MNMNIMVANTIITRSFNTLSRRRGIRLVDCCSNNAMVFINDNHGRVVCRNNNKFNNIQKRFIHPVVWMIVKPLAKAGSIILGRTTRVWYKNLASDRKQKFWKTISWEGVGIGVSFILGFAFLNYAYHTHEAPITNRKRFIAITDQQLLKICDIESENILENNRDNILPLNHPFYKRVKHIIGTLVNANQDVEFLKKQQWKIVIVNHKDVNAMVLANGCIYVFSGLLEQVVNDSQLAFVLAHEMSHAILQHAAENLSRAQLIDMMVIVVMAMLWLFIPSDGIAIVSQWFYHKIVDLFLHLPYSRKLETEADQVGLTLTAKACYDVRESSNFWRFMHLRKLNDGNDLPEWLSTHPTDENREEALDDLVPAALKIRHSSNCYNLPAKDPRIAIRQFKTATIRELKENRLS